MHAGEVSSHLGLLRPILALVAVALLLPMAGGAAAQTQPQGAQVALQQAYSQLSWGLGLVVPDGSSLAGGETLNWARVSNVSAIVQIPNITNASGTVYAVVSLMTRDGVVLQTAFGIYPGNSSWLLYSMYISDIDQTPQHYTWTINSSGPAAGPGDLVVLSIFQTLHHTWGFMARNLNTSLSMQREFGVATTDSPRQGDQEVFAVESYSGDPSTFQKMGNLTLGSLLVDGRRVTAGWYTFADWDMLRSPLFVVGGAAPPQFIGISVSSPGTAVWYYAGTWKGTGQTGGTTPVLVAAAILAGASVGGVLLSRRYIRRRTNGLSGTEVGQQESTQNRLK